MGVPCKLHVASLSTLRQPKNCADLGTLAFCEMQMLPQWHPAMTSTLKLYTCWSAVLKNCRTEAGAVIARSWWRWHTKQRTLWRPDLVTSCLFLCVSNTVRRSLPSTTDATDSKSLISVSAVRSRESVNDPSAFLPNFTSKIAACESSSSSSLDSHRSQTCVLWRQFLHGLTDNCFF